jgi:hypothetical protein
MTNWFVKNKESIIRSAFLVPIFSVATISISHVVSWYDLANPISWAIYLSIAVEIAAMSAIAAASVKVKGFSVWFVFIIVTLIQFIGNIFFSYSDIDVTSKAFKDWSELTAPVFESLGSDTTDLLAQKRWLALLEGGLLPLISLTCLHFFIKYGERDSAPGSVVESTAFQEEPVSAEEETSIVPNESTGPVAIPEVVPAVEPEKRAESAPKEETIQKRPPLDISPKMKKIQNAR